MWYFLNWFFVNSYSLSKCMDTQTGILMDEIAYFSMFSSVFKVQGCPENGSSLVSSCPSLICLYHSKTCVIFKWCTLTSVFPYTCKREWVSVMDISGFTKNFTCFWHVAQSKYLTFFQQVEDTWSNTNEGCGPIEQSSVIQPAGMWRGCQGTL